MQSKKQQPSVDAYAFYDPSTPQPSHSQQTNAYSFYQPTTPLALEQDTPQAQHYNYILDDHKETDRLQESLLQQHETKRQQLELALDNQISEEIVKMLAQQAKKTKKDHPKLQKVLGPDKYYPNPIMMKSIQAFSAGFFCILFGIGFYAFDYFNYGDPYLVFMFCLNMIGTIYCFLVITWPPGEVLSFLASVLCQIIAFGIIGAQIFMSLLAIVVGCFAYRLADHMVLYTIAENLIYGGIWLCVPLTLLFLLTLQAIRIRLPEVNDLPDPKYVDTHRTGIEVAPKREPIYCVPDVYFTKVLNKIKDKFRATQQKTQYIEDDQDELKPNFEEDDDSI